MARVSRLTQEQALVTLHVRCALDADAKTFVPAVNSRLRERFGVSHSTIQVDYADCLDEHHK
jgi:cobalt-zinc-cadmium efflux system protein